MPCWPDLHNPSSAHSVDPVTIERNLDIPAAQDASPAPTVMVIDDHPANIRLLTALLLPCGYQVSSAASGAEGLAMIRVASPDLVLLDMRMPGLDGFEVLEQLRQAEATKDIPVIFLTADDDQENLIRAFAAGATDYLTKPFVLRELLARVRMQIDLKISRDQLQRFAREKQDMAERIAHDMRNYFSNITLAAELLSSLPAVDAGVVSLARSIRSSADSGFLFLHALLEHQEQEAGGVGIEPLPVGQLLCDAVDLLESSARARSITLELRAHPTIIVSGLRTGAAAVLQNLLSNAIKYSPCGSRIRISASSHATQGRMNVMDRGPGINGAERQKLFQRFSRTASAPTAGESGTGLGLALAKQQARAMGGDLWFDPRIGGGSSFTFELPLA
ncbi:hybrid sensor histidine kinase/response regulator [soil metagenome]